MSPSGIWKSRIDDFDGLVFPLKVILIFVYVFHLPFWNGSRWISCWSWWVVRFWGCEEVILVLLFENNCDEWEDGVWLVFWLRCPFKLFLWVCKNRGLCSFRVSWQVLPSANGTSPSNYSCFVTNYNKLKEAPAQKGLDSLSLADCLSRWSVILKIFCTKSVG